ncbi:hypothetical protein AWB99_22050 [Mycolicibacterium confluentis]|nr:hypothetical protein AWB99_22050 [Mycolicibacterium confluentis]
MTRRIAAAATLAVAPALIALGVASSASAQAPVTGGPSISASAQHFGPMPERSAHQNIHHRDNRPIHQNSINSAK